MKKSTKRKLKNIRYSLRRKAFTFYSILKYNNSVWKFINRTAIKAFRKNPPKLSPLENSLIEQLNKTGIAVTDLESLFPNENILNKFNEYLDKRSNRVYPNKKKPFLEDLLPETPELGPEVPFFNVAISKPVLNIVNSYLGMHSRLFYFFVRKTKLSGNKLPYHSQNWHRAPQEHKNCRVYIYLSDVDVDSGPFVYIPESTHDKKYGHIIPQTALTRGYSSAEVVETNVPKEDQMVVTGKAGTVIFCDSTGLHRGGYSNKNTRTMVTLGYGAPSFRENINYSYPRNLIEKLKEYPEAMHVLNPKWYR